MVVVDDYSVSKSLSTSTSPSFASSSPNKKSASSQSSKKSASSLSRKPEESGMMQYGQSTRLNAASASALSNGRVGPAIRRSSAQVHKTMEAKQKENSLQSTAMSAATWLFFGSEGQA
jgi:hypothetical protein